jgi:hypothetical protein
MADSAFGGRNDDPQVRIPPRRAENPSLISIAADVVEPRMYTEEEVSVIIQVSLSQLRKWRMKGNSRRVDGPPFKKIGRMVRYPAKALDAYINCADGE